MIDCGIGVKSAKKIGEMLEKGSSLTKLNLWGENPLNIRSSSVGIKWISLAHVHPLNRDGVLGIDIDCLCVGLQVMMRLEIKESFESQKD
jgi:hypothetical protein